MIESISPLEAAWLGLVEGLTEYLPVSSTGHLILAAAWLGLTGDPAANAFQIVIQSGAILAVLGLYRARVARMLGDAGHALGMLGREGPRAVLASLNGGELPGLRLAIQLGLAFLPAALLGPFLDDAIEALLFYPLPVAAALALGSVAIFAMEPLRKKRAESGKSIDELSYAGALAIGCIQCLAMIPGTSRSLSTILGGIGVGLRPAAAAEFSFLLGLPTLGGATLYKSLDAGDLLINDVGPLALFVGVAVATVSAALAVKAFVSWLNRHGLVPFGIYRILLAIAVFFFWPE